MPAGGAVDVVVNNAGGIKQARGVFAAHSFYATTAAGENVTTPNMAAAIRIRRSTRPIARPWQRLIVCAAPAASAIALLLQYFSHFAGR